ncbi:MAG: class I SAM-dependent methyltransferase [Anaerolineae bacterium]
MTEALNLRTLLRAYPSLTWRDRLHMIIRWRVCPMQKIAALVPTDGVILDLGCGHGLFAQMLARGAAARQVIGVDLDADKVALAQTLTERLPNVQFEAGDVADLAADLPPAQAITILDVFYLVPFAVQERLLTLCADKLASGGVLILKEMAETPRWKAFLNWLEETLAVRVLKITASSEEQVHFYFRPRAEWQKLLEQRGLTVEIVKLDAGYYHPHVVFIGRKP